MGLLCEGDDADFIITDDLKNFIIKQTYINGLLVAENGKSLINSVPEIAINQFDCAAIAAEDLSIAANAYPVIDGKIPVMEALDGQLITNKLWLEPSVEDGNLVSDTNRDLLKMVVVNRYHEAPIAKCFIQNFGFKRGAIASSVAHDSHNIVAVGVDNASLAKAINLVIKERGGVSVVDGDLESVLGLPVAGLMSTDDGYQVAAAYTKIDRMAKDLGSSLQAPFMTLSFMALLVIPHLKLSDKGLFDGDNFSFIPLVQDQAS
jgi:adenine deaminase